MDFSGIANELSAEVYKAVARILALSIAAAEKEAMIVRLVGNTSIIFRAQVYDASSAVFDSTIAAKSNVADRAEVGRLANKVVRNHALGRMSNQQTIDSYYNRVLGQAQHEAFTNAQSMQKVPTLTRTITGLENCQWCEAKQGTYTNPTGDDFARHANCDCIFQVYGYNMRNGLLKNYVKEKPVQGGQRIENEAQKAMEDALNAGNTARAQEIVNNIQDPSLKSGLQATLDALSGKSSTSRVRVDPVTKKIIRV